MKTRSRRRWKRRGGEKIWVWTRCRGLLRNVRGTRKSRDAERRLVSLGTETRRKRPFVGHILMSAGDFFLGWRENVSSLLLPWAQSLCFKPFCRPSQLRLCCPQRAALPVCTVLAQPPGTN